MLGRLPDDLNGKRVLDAGAGAGQMTEALARRGAEVVAADISPSLLDVAKRRIPESLHDQIEFRAGDMLDESLGHFDHIVAMDSLIHYKIGDIGDALAKLGARCDQSMVFTIAPSTAFLKAFWAMGQVFPRSDRSPQIIPHSDRSLARAVSSNPVLTRFMLGRVRRVSRGFYISQCDGACPVILGVQQVKRISVRLLPFSDAASPGLPLGQLLRLSLFPGLGRYGGGSAARHAEPGDDRRTGRAATIVAIDDRPAGSDRAVSGLPWLPV